MSAIVDPDLEDYARRSTRPEPELLQQLATRTHAEMESPQMLTGRLEGRLLKLLVQIHQPRLIVEVGTFTGYSALSMAEGLSDKGRILTCEIDPKARRVAQEAFDRSPHGHKIEMRMGPALETILSLDEPVDFSFIDADKQGYPDYYEALLSRTRPGGLILMDNMLMGGRVLDPQEPGPQAIHGLNQAIAIDDRVENVLLTVRDGVQLLRKTSDSDGH
jgi:predicted O-methyltransferase YrrM